MSFTDIQFIHLQPCIHFFHFIIKCFSIIYKPLPDINILVSSANISVRNLVNILARSFMYIKNNRGPKIDSWGTPHIIFFFDEDTLSYSTY